MDYDVQETVFWGYKVKRRLYRAAEHWVPEHVTEICCVTECGQEDIDFLELGYYDYYERGTLALESDAEEAIEKVIRGTPGIQREAWSLLALYVHAHWFEKGGVPHSSFHPRPSAQQASQPMDDVYEFLGYDVLQVDEHGFGCSPLFCNGMGREVAVNTFCLIADLPDALRAAKSFAVGQAEPGDYLVVEVWRRKA